MNPADLAADFARFFGRPPAVRAEAPGRVNLIGEHTDYNEGWVLPLAIPQRVRVAAAARTDGLVRVWSAEESEADEVAEFVPGDGGARPGWLAYVEGAIVGLERTVEGASGPAAGRALGGFEAAIRSDVPIGAGLASSAAFLIALLRALVSLHDLDLDPLTLASVARAAEDEFAGAHVGMMDPLACLLASPERALFLDTRTFERREVALPPDCEIVVIDSGLRHAHAGGEYNARREECAEIARRLGVRSLRDLEGAEFARAFDLPPMLARRLRHVTSENRRVHEAVHAMEAGDSAELGRLLDASHRSLRDDYEVSLPDIDLLVELALGQEGVLGGRLTGGGFGGSCVFVARRGEGARAGARAAATYARATGRPGRLLLPLDQAGVRERSVASPIA